jgi:hypothetical protein
MAQVSHAIVNPAHVAEFLYAGHATFTLSSLRSGDHYTYRLSSCDDKPAMFFCSLLTAPDTYQYIGLVEHNAFRLTRKSKMNDDSTPVKAMRYFLGHLLKQVIAPDLEFRHEGHCGRCGRELTVPESIDRGLGPTCAGKTHQSLAA